MLNNIKDLMKWLNENQWLNLIFLILAILSIIVSFYLYFKSKKQKIPTYLIKTFNLLKDRINKIEEVKIKYADKEINTLSITKVAFWNRGNDVINKSDVAPKEPIRIQVDDEFEILNSSIIYKTNDVNNFSLINSPDKKSVIIDFDFLFYGEGITIEIYHTGISNKNIKFIGRLKDVSECSPAEFEKNVMFGYVLDKTVGKLRNKMSYKNWKIFTFSSLPFLMPILVPIMLIETITGFTKSVKIPKQFSLEDEE